MHREIILMPDKCVFPIVFHDVMVLSKNYKARLAESKFLLGRFIISS